MKRIFGMKCRLTVFMIAVMTAITAFSQNVTLKAVDKPAAEVFRLLMTQTGKNFIYPANLLKGINVTVDVTDAGLEAVMRQMFKNHDIEWKIEGKNVVLRAKPKSSEKPEAEKRRKVKEEKPVDGAHLLDEVVVKSRLEMPAVETAEIGARKLTAEELKAVPALFGEPDVIKALQMQPGISDGAEGMAGMLVHGGGADENLCMLDNVPLYQVNHFAGLFSAFNIDAVRYIDFYKSSFPAKYDGRLSSFLDVRTINGSHDGHHGSGRLGLTSGAFSINGPISDRTTYMVALRRSWYDVLTIPIFAVVNAKSDDEKVSFGYAFTDLNAKIRHQFDERTSAYAGFYFGDDAFHTRDKSGENYADGFFYDDKHRFRWGNIVAQTGLIRKFTPELSAEFTLAYTRCYSSLKGNEKTVEKYDGSAVTGSRSKVTTKNNINDVTARADFSWNAGEKSKVRFGASYTLHTFQPARTLRETRSDSTLMASRDSSWSYRGSELNAYIEDDWQLTDRLRVNAGIHGSMFRVDKKTHWGVSPRLSLSYRLNDNWALKGSYSHTVQYVHQLTQSYLALPTDQWIPVTGKFKPETADKTAVGVYWQSGHDGDYTVEVEGYWKTMHNLMDYSDEYYLHPPLEMWNARLTPGRGTAKGIDVKIEKRFGRLTGHAAYSYAWADRTFAGKNGGKTFPVRFGNGHTINIALNWQISRRVEASAAWTGHTGNRYTLLNQSWECNPDGEIIEGDDNVALRAPINSYTLPFYHRLDLSLKVRNSRGYWTFGLYNAYCHMNTIGVRRSDYTAYRVNPDGSVVEIYHPVFQKISLLPIIPSISYTWLF